MKYIFRFLLSIILFTACIDINTIRPKTARDYYELGLSYIDTKEYTKAINTFSQGISIADPITDEYYLSMCYFELAFTYSLSGNQKEALKNIEILLSQVVSSKEARVLAENLRRKIIEKKSYQNATY